MSPHSPSPSSKLIDTPSSQRTTHLRRLLRRIFLLACFALLMLPMTVQLLKLEIVDPNLENRTLAEYPGKPKNKEELLLFTSRFDRYLNDHFGLRQRYVQWNQTLRYAWLGEAVSPQLTVGRDGYLFFNAHESKHPLRMLEFVCGRHISDQQIDELAQQIAQFAHFVDRTKQPTTIAFVPTKPVVYANYLPAWWQQECQRFQASMPRVMARLNEYHENTATQRTRIVYPLQEMLAAKTKQQLYPLHDFHWQGRGAQAYAQIIAEQIWHRSSDGEFAFLEELSQSDMQRFMPGVDLRERLQKPDWQNSPFEICEGAACFPELPHASLLADVTRIKRRQKPEQHHQKLLLITDSFGHGVAPYFIPYYDEVWHVSSNNMGALGADQLRQLKQAFETYGAHQTLYLFHDFAASCFSQQLNYCPLKLPPVLMAVHPSVP